MDSEHRSVPRIDLPGGVPGEVSVLAPVEVRQFTVRGAMLDTAFPLILNSIHDLRLTLGDNAVIVKGRVAHCSIADLGAELVRYRAGIEFIDLTEHAASAITAYLERMQQTRASVAAGSGTSDPA